MSDKSNQEYGYPGAARLAVLRVAAEIGRNME